MKKLLLSILIPLSASVATLSAATPSAAPVVTNAAGTHAAGSQAAGSEAAAVMTLRNDGGLTEGEVNIITERVEFVLMKNGPYKLVSRRDLEQILKEQGFQQTGSCTETSCIVEIGQVLAVQKMIAGSIGKLGSLYSVSLKVYDVKTGALVTQVSRDVPGSKENLLSKGIPDVVGELCTGLGSAPQTAKKPTSKMKVPLIVGGAAVGAAVVGVVVYLALPKQSSEEPGSTTTIPEITVVPPARGVAP